MKDYYNILGINKDSTPSEIRSAFRQLARQYHPDVNKDPESEEKFKTLGEAYGVLSDPVKRQKYDRGSLGDEATDIFYRSPEGGIKIKPDIFNRMMGVLFPGGDRIFEKGAIPKQEIFLPENDLGLIAALVKAYSSKTDGEWWVRPSNNDGRDWMPEDLYAVKKKNGTVSVFRSITDWRNADKRDEEIALKDEKERWKKGPKTFESDNLFGEPYLSGNLRNDFYDEGGISPIPASFGSYLNAIKSYAKKVAEGRTDFEDDLNRISAFSTIGQRNIRVEGIRSWLNEEDNGWVRKYKVKDLPLHIREAEDLVSREGDNQGAEGTGKIG